ncbi:HpcH/HpaI aldolase/citrate lyase family protein [Micromonospora inyonensis]|nr:CoA ester lyase [Micromonospora inyonensis]
MTTDPSAPSGALLFVPGDRPDRFTKASATGADHVIVDLEDAVAAASKHGARQSTAAWLASGREAIVRVNGVGTSWHEPDLRMVSGRASFVLLPKCEDAGDVSRFVSSCDSPTLALIETPLGLAAAHEIAATGVAGLVFGNVDFAANIGVDPASQPALQLARSQLVYASAAAGLPAPIDGVTTRLTESEALDADLTHARELGFGGKLCVHPSQVAPTQVAFLPTEEEVAWAVAVLDASPGVAAVAGQMVDAPVVIRAQSILDRHRKNDRTPDGD